MNKVTIEEIMKSKIKDPVNPRCIFTNDGRLIGRLTVCLTRDGSLVLNKYVANVMNGLVEPDPEKVWTRVPNQTLTMNGIKHLTVCSYLPVDVREWLLGELLEKLNRPRSCALPILTETNAQSMRY